MRYFLIIISFLLSATAGYATDTRYDPITIAYDDYGQLLKQTVMTVGRSDRRPAPKPTLPTGTLIYRGSQEITRLEGNRLFYHSFTDGTLKALSTMLQSLSAVSSQVNLSRLHPDERLAYWLNLHNMAVIHAVGQIYPVQKLENHIPQILTRKDIRVSGELWSIADIEQHVTDNWRDLRVIYGFYRGHIGGPNIRRKPYTAKTVWDDLDDNARDFVGSLRGIQFNGETMRLSEFYIEMMAALPKSEEAFKDHLATYATPLMMPKIYNASRVRMDINDWTPADLYEGVTASLTSVNDNPAALLGATTTEWVDFLAKSAHSSINHYPPHVQNFVRDLTAKYKRQRAGAVTIDDVSNKTGQH